MLLSDFALNFLTFSSKRLEPSTLLDYRYCLNTHVVYQVPVNARRLPLVFWHGHGQSARTWESTPDGREGIQTKIGSGVLITHSQSGRLGLRLSTGGTK
jgi:hypothetical protein